MDNQLVATHGVTKSFGMIKVLDGVDFNLERGQVTCIFGPSGSGKTTFLRCLNQLETIDGGSVMIDGELIGLREERDYLVRLRAKQIAKQRAKIGMVFQHFNLFPHRTVLENLIEAPVHVQKLAKAEATKIALEMLDRVGLASKRNQYPDQLSGGQKQRVAIARALTMKPKLMLFDEPTSALDPELVGEVLGTMKELARDGMAMIVVTHEIGFGREVADNAVFFDEGKVLAAGPPSEVLDGTSNPRIERFLAKVL